MESPNRWKLSYSAKLALSTMVAGGAFSLVPIPYRETVLGVLQGISLALMGAIVILLALLFTKKARKRVTPELGASWAGFLVPRAIRGKCYKPFLEDLKADRAEKIARTASRRLKRWIEFCFYFRLAVTVVQSLGCYLGDLAAKIAPFIRALFFKGGS